MKKDDDDEDEAVCWPDASETVFDVGDDVLVIGWTEYGYGTELVLHPTKLVIESWSVYSPE